MKNKKSAVNCQMVGKFMVIIFGFLFVNKIVNYLTYHTINSFIIGQQVSDNLAVSDLVSINQLIFFFIQRSKIEIMISLLL